MAEFAKHPELELLVKTGLAADKLVAEIGDSVGLVVRSATQASRDLIGAGRNLKVIGRAARGSTTSTSRLHPSAASWS